MADKRESTGFLIKQRAYLKLFILNKIGTRRIYGQQIVNELKSEMNNFNYHPYHSEIYRSLQDLLEDGYIKRQRSKLKKDSYQEIYLYYIKDADKVNAYNQLVKQDLDRCKALIDYALEKNF